MTGTLVEEALRSTYQLAGSDADRLRRLTRSAGLEAENILSRLAIVRSATELDAEASGATQPSRSARLKEIKGAVLLGRARPAALLLVLVARHPAPEGVQDLRAKVNWHWARGLRLLESEARASALAGQCDPLRPVAQVLVALPQSESGGEGRAKAGGLGRGGRDLAAAAVGRLYPRWGTEVRRLVAMAARLDPNRVGVAASRVAEEAESRGHTHVSESVVLTIMADWGLNRLGLSDRDRTVLSALVDGSDVVDEVAGTDSQVFLSALGLIHKKSGRLVLTERGRRMGSEAMQK